MNALNIQRVGVIGAGTMGNGIAHVFAKSGRRVMLVDLTDALLDHGLQKIETNLNREVEKGKLSATEADAVLARIEKSTDLAALSESDLVVEAASENIELKLELFRQIDGICMESTILASNTSSISITRIGAATNRPAKTVGMHFMNPVPVMQLVEIIRGNDTDDMTHQAVVALARELGKTPVTVSDYPGFVSNRILMPMINEAVFCLMEGVAERDAIDDVMKLGMAHPLGPLALADLIGLDTCLSILEVLHRELGEDKYRPCPLLRKMVAAGALGRKAGKGFYLY